MNQFSIRDIENLCGVKAHTLRIWEQRYNLFIPKRKESKHRIYDCEDLKQLLQISFLYHHGYKISRIAAMTQQQIQEEIATIKPSPCDYELFIHQLTEASIQFDKVRFEKIINSLVLRIGLEKSIIHVFYPFLHRIGLLWMTNHVIPAQEHFSSHIIRKKIICAIDGIEQKPGSDAHVVIFTPPGERHEIPLLVVNYLLRKNGVRTTYFGTAVETTTLHYFVKHHPATHFYTHIITQLDTDGINEFIGNFCRVFPRRQLIISGPASSCIQQKPANLLHLQSLDEVLHFAYSFATVVKH